MAKKAAAKGNRTSLKGKVAAKPRKPETQNRTQTTPIANSRSKRSSNGDSTGTEERPSAKSKTERPKGDGEKGILLNLVSVESLGIPTKERPFLVEYFPSLEQIRAELQVREYELESQRNAAERVLATHRHEWETELSSQKQRASINVALRTKLGHVVAPLQYVILVDVAEKLPTNVLESRGLYELPPTCCGIAVKVRQIRVASMVGNITSMAGTTPIPSATASGVIQGGIAITASGTGVHGDFGTLGICIPKSASNDLFGISNFHVVGNPGNKVSAVGKQIGKVSDPVGKNPFCDAAAILRSATATFVEGVAKLGFASNQYRFLMNDDLFGLRQLQRSAVFKVGAAMPNRVNGQITHLSRSVDVPDLSSRAFLQVVEVQNSQTPFIRPGDSGSVLVQEVSTSGSSFPLIIGLNFAGSDDGKTSYAIPFGQVIKKLKVDLGVPASRLVTL